jgi:hypothetical protein
LNYPELVSTIKKKIMKTLNFNLTTDIFNEFALSNEEMIYVRGGDGGEGEVLPTEPPIILGS